MSFIFVFGLFSALRMTAPPENTSRVIKPIMTCNVAVGPKVKGELGRCDTDAEWQMVLNRIRGETADWSRPDVDFGANIVLVICHDTLAAGTRLYEVTEDATQIRVRYSVGGIQAGPPSRDEAERSKQEQWLARKHTFRATFVVLPATRKPFVFEEGVGGTISKPDDWKERARVKFVEKK